MSATAAEPSAPPAADVLDPAPSAPPPEEPSQPGEVGPVLGVMEGDEVQEGAASNTEDGAAAPAAEPSSVPSSGASASSPGGAEAAGGGEEDGQSAFECNICLDVARDAVISVCGHLFCWPCLHQWLETRPNRQICPVCKAGISRDKVIPLYGRGSTDQKDPRDKVPPRPRGQRPEPENTGGPGGLFNPFNMGGNAGGGGGFQMSFGIGAFPFGFFATNFNLGDGMGPGVGGARMRQPNPNNPAQMAQFQEEQFLQKVFLWVALAFIFWLMVA